MSVLGKEGGGGWKRRRAGGIADEHQGVIPFFLTDSRNAKVSDGAIRGKRQLLDQAYVGQWGGVCLKQ